LTTATFKKLETIVKNGFLLHGSYDKFKTLHGRPLYATDNPAYAMLFAIGPRGKDAAYCLPCPEKGEIHASKGFVEGMRNGYVYAMIRGPFHIGKDKEFCTWDEVIPLECIEVKPEDFPYPIVQGSASEIATLKHSLGNGTVRKGFRNGYRRS